MKVTIKDVAKHAGVSPATAARVVGGYGYVAEETRRKVQEAVRVLGYRPNTIARSMVTKSTRTIGVVITDITNPFFAQLVRSIEEVAWQRGYTLILANTDEDSQREQAVLNALLEKRVDAFILVPASSQSLPHLHDLVRQEAPVVLVDRAVEGLAVDMVMVDNEAGAYQAVRHLIDLGHRRIGIVLDKLDITTNKERLKGYRRALQESGLSAEAVPIQSCHYTSQSAYQVVNRMLGEPGQPTALFTANNFMTIGALKAVQEAGLRVPEDIALVGFDDLEWTQLNAPQLTIVAQPVTQMGEIAAQIIISRLQGGSAPPMEIRLKTTFIVRTSCGVHATRNANQNSNQG
ncbi:MAG: LacI family DNA-binding transcriptional regulator [Anaerolineales bacterium]|nr:LacI family DNA-binding transcriptional regulator [Anaerolineales bacterium]